jgi:CDP-diacylglycerol--serine O-phosphatidyltransferase
MDGRPGRLGRIRRRPRYHGPSFNRVVPNLLTLLGLCAGLTSIRAALDGRLLACSSLWPA